MAKAPAKPKALPTDLEFAKMLAPLLAGVPKPVFPGGKTGDPQRKMVVEKGYVELMPLRIEKVASTSKSRNGGIPKATTKSVKFQDLKLTAKGREFVLRELGGRELLEPLPGMVEATETAMKSQLTHLESKIVALHDLVSEITSMQTKLAESVGKSIAGLQQVISHAVTRPVTVKIESKGGATGPDIDKPLADYVKQWHTDKGTNCPFDSLFKHLLESCPTLTIGYFHDTLRRLHEEKTVRVSAWTEILADIPSPEYVFMISTRPMYYAQSGA